MKHIYMSLLGLFLTAAAMGQAHTAPADTSKDLGYTLDVVEISGNTKKNTLDQPVSVVKLTPTEIKRSTGLFLDDVINTNVPGVFMQRRSISGGQQFNIRGYGNGARGTNGVNSNFDAQGLKVYLNGIPITDAEGITVLDDIDFGSIGDVEIIKGPAGSLYGLAVAGVVNLKTVRPEKNQTSIGQEAMIGSYGLNRFTTTLQTGSDSASLLVNYGRQNYDGFTPHTASHKDFVNLVGDFQPNKRQTITTYFGYSNSYDERNGELTREQYETLDYSGNPNYIKNNAHSAVTSLRAGIGHTYKFSKNFSNTTFLFGSGANVNNSSAGGWTDRQPLNYGLRSTFDANVVLSDHFGLTGTLGVETQRQDAQSIGYRMVLDSANPTGYNIIGPMRSNQATMSKTTSAFTEWTLNMPYDFSLTAGIGASTMGIALDDRIYSAANNRPAPGIPSHYETTYDGMYSPHVAINKVFGRHVSAYASYSVGYKAPVSSYFFIPTTGQLNTGLKPEKGTQYEIGTKGSLLKNRLQYQVAVFDAIFANKMTAVAVPLDSMTTAYTYVANGGSQDNRGVEALIKYTVYQSATGFVQYVRPFANGTYSQFKYKDFRFQTLNKAGDEVTTLDYSGNAVAGVPPITANVGVDFMSKPGIYANATFSYRDKMPFTSDGEHIADSYSLLNAKLGYRHSLTKHFDLDAYFGANNITGEQYYQMVFLNQLPDAYIPAPNEMNFFGGANLRYKF